MKFLKVDEGLVMTILWAISLVLQTQIRKIILIFAIFFKFFEIFCLKVFKPQEAIEYLLRFDDRALNSF